jgi:hypothetical protein
MQLIMKKPKCLRLKCSFVWVWYKRKKVAYATFLRLLVCVTF